MIEYDQTIPMKYREEPDYAIEYLQLYFRERWLENMCEKLKNGYAEMSQINLSLAEMGLEQDIRELCIYELKLVGREEL